jgi:DNA-binding GntR family transcriptional regulator
VSTLAVAEAAGPAPTQGRIAYERLEAMIVTGRLPAGAAVSENGLSQLLGIGRMPVREALKRLADEGLVRVLPQRGVLVAPLDVAEHLQRLEARRPMDRLLAELAARRATAPERARLAELADAMARAADGDDVEGFMAVDRAFDDLIESAARNRVAARIAASLHAHSRRFWFAHRAAADLDRSSGHHGRLMRAIAAGDPGEAARASDALIDYLDTAARGTL